MEGDYLNSPLFTDKEKAVIRWAEAFTRNTARHDDAAFQELKRHFSEREIMELSLASGLFNLYNRLQESFHTDLDEPEHVHKVGVPRITKRRLLDYIRRALADEEAPQPEQRQA
ncbi:MAG: carboxymuconolactone decarboxylase family protein [Chloroflexi bacterium]|nr:carboxymuconolactone decarboxylase family protein [Chloroflexota bacterium]